MSCYVIRFRIIHAPRRVNQSDLCDSLTVPLAPLTGRHFWRLLQYQQNCCIEGHEIVCRYLLSPEDEPQPLWSLSAFASCTINQSTISNGKQPSLLLPQYSNKCWIECHQVVCRYPWSPEDEPDLVTPTFLFSTSSMSILVSYL